MSRPILAGFDPRTLDGAPVHFGVAFARLTGAPLVVAVVQAEDRPPRTAPAAHELDPDLVDDCTAAVEDLEPALAATRLRVDCLKLAARSAAQALHEEAEREDAALLVVGSSRRAVARRVLLGSTALRLFAGAPCPVAVVPSGWGAADPLGQAALGTIGVAYVDSEEGRDALRDAHALAAKAGARLRVITVIRPTFEMYGETGTYIAGTFGKRLEDVEGEHALAVRQDIERRLAELAGGVVAEVDVVVGDPEEDPAEHLIRISEHLDLLLCGSRGYGPVRAVLLGSVSARVTAAAQCPVIVLPRGVKASLESLVRETAGAAAI